MKKFIILFILLLSFGNSYAQDHSKAKAILEAVSQQTKSYPSIEIYFNFTIENKSKKTKETKSGIACMKGDKYYFSIAGQEVFCDGKTIWTYLKESNEVQITETNPDMDQSLNPVKMLTDYNKNYTPKFIKEETRGPKIIQIIDLTPIKPKSYYKIRIEIDKLQKQVINAIIYDKNGINIYYYSITKSITDKTIPDSRFTFKTSDYPGVEVIDLR